MNKKDVEYLRVINIERIKINEELNNFFTELVRKGESLENYEIWINKKCSIMIQPIFIIQQIVKDLEKNGFNEDVAYVIIKKN